MKSLERSIGELDGKVGYMHKDIRGISHELTKNTKTTIKLAQQIENHLNSHNIKERRSWTIAGIVAALVSGAAAVLRGG